VEIPRQGKLVENQGKIKKVQGWTALSPSDPEGRGLLYFTRDGAEEHKNTMNAKIKNYPIKWNTTYWPTVPEPWEVYELHLGNKL
jgi:hypothetical protein